MLAIGRCMNNPVEVQADRWALCGGAQGSSLRYDFGILRFLWQ